MSVKTLREELLEQKQALLCKLRDINIALEYLPTESPKEVLNESDIQIIEDAQVNIKRRKRTDQTWKDLIQDIISEAGRDVSQKDIVNFLKDNYHLVEEKIISNVPPAIHNLIKSKRVIRVVAKKGRISNTYILHDWWGTGKYTSDNYLLKD